MARWTKVVPVVAAMAIVGGGAVAVGLGLGDRTEPVTPSAVVFERPNARPATLTGAWPTAADPDAHPTSWTVADATGPTVTLFSAPDVPLADRPEMANPTHEGLPVVFVVLEERGEWLHVRVSRRPNGFTAWVRRAEVSLRTVPYWIKVEVGARRVSVVQGEVVRWQTTAAVGTDRTPTPLGTFFVDGWVPLAGNGPYGAGQLSVAGFSDVLHSFGGGVGQIAIHGTNRPELLGQPVSNGCVRLENAQLLELVAMAPLGTPVEVYA